MKETLTLLFLYNAEVRFALHLRQLSNKTQSGSVLWESPVLSTGSVNVNHKQTQPTKNFPHNGQHFLSVVNNLILDRLIVSFPDCCRYMFFNDYASTIWFQVCKILFICAIIYFDCIAYHNFCIFWVILSSSILINFSFVCLFVWGLSSANFNLCSALKAIEQLGCFSVPSLLWHETSVYNGNLRGHVTLTPIAERLAVDLSITAFTT